MAKYAVEVFGFQCLEEDVDQAVGQQRRTGGNQIEDGTQDYDTAFQITLGRGTHDGLGLHIVIIGNRIGHVHPFGATGQPERPQIILMHYTFFEEKPVVIQPILTNQFVPCHNVPFVLQIG